MASLWFVTLWPYSRAPTPPSAPFTHRRHTHIHTRCLQCIWTELLIEMFLFPSKKGKGHPFFFQCVFVPHSATPLPYKSKWHCCQRTHRYQSAVLCMVFKSILDFIFFPPGKSIFMYGSYLFLTLHMQQSWFTVYNHLS